MVNKKTPIALFTYNRPDHTRLVLESLERCRRIEDCDLFIYCDGPKSTHHIEGVEASRQVVRSWALRLNAEVIERSENFGLARSIVTGVTELCERYGRAIVIEDDLVLSPSFVDYMLYALDHYEDQLQVYQISGFMFPVKHRVKPDAFLLPLTTSWGWATWQRAWLKFDWSASNAQEKLADNQLRKCFNLDNSYPYYSMLEDRLNGRNDSWAILWWWSVFQAEGLVLHPRKSLVWVGGFDGSGTHCGNQPDQGPIVQLTVNEFPSSYTLPEKIQIDQEAFTEIKSFLRKQQHAQNRVTRFISRRVVKKFWTVLGVR